MSEADWSQKFRPKTIDDVLLPAQFKKKIEQAIVTKGGMSMLFHGKPGCGKTTLARVLNPDGLYQINCTINNSIADIRHLQRTISAKPIDADRRLVLLDEADYLTPDAQAALRGLVEEFSASNDFVMTANDPSRLSDAIKSRFIPVGFDFVRSDEHTDLLKKHLRYIAEHEGYINVNDTFLGNIVKRRFPDIRLMIKELQLEIS